MDYMKLKLSIYESYGNGEMTSEACSHLIDSLDMKYGESIAEEAANAENDFINASLKVFTESASEGTLTEAAKDFGAKIKAAWEKFKAWIKKIIEKILNLGKKPEQQKAKIQVPKALDKALSDARKWITKLGGAKTAGAMATAIAGIVSSTALIIKNRKLKETIGAKTYEYEKFKKDQADLVKQMQDAALSAQKEIENLKTDNTRLTDIGMNLNSTIVSLRAMLADAEKRLAAAQTKAKEDTDYLARKNDDQKQTIGAQQIKIGDQNDEIIKLKKEVEDLKKQIADANAKAKEAKSRNGSNESVTDSRIISASTGFVNAVTQTVVSLLPQYSSRTTDDIDVKIPSSRRRDGSFTATGYENPDLKLLYEAESAGRKTCNLIRDLINSKFMVDDSIISDYLKKIDDISRYNSDINHSIDKIEKEFKNKLEAKYNFDTIDGIKAFANDYSSGTGLVGSMIKDAVNRAKSISSMYNKYNIDSKRVEFSKATADAAIKDYAVVYQSYKICYITYHIIRRMASNLKNKIHNVNDKY